MATIKQKTAAKKLSDSIRSGKPKTMKRVLTESGYSESVSNKPKIVTERKGWKELLEEEFPDEIILKVHKRLLEKQELLRNSDGDYEKSGQPHSDVKGALDLIYKLKGRYLVKPEDEDRQIVVVLRDFKASETKPADSELTTTQT